MIGETDGSGDSSNRAWVFLFFPKNKKLAEKYIESCKKYTEGK